MHQESRITKQISEKKPTKKWSIKDIDQMLSLLPKMEEPEFLVARWLQPSGYMPFPTYHPAVEALLALLFKSTAFIDAYTRLPEDPSWYEPGFGTKDLMRDPKRLVAATLDQIRRYLVLCTQGEHFGDGYIQGEFEQGRFLAVLRRLREIRTGMDAPNSKAAKVSVHLAGEYYVAAELHRRGVYATITYGNAKSADILAFSLDGERFTRVEVKSSRPSNGSILAWSGTLDGFPVKPNQFWVLCIVPNVGDEWSSPRFFVFESDEMRRSIQAKFDAYHEKVKGAGDSSKWLWDFPMVELEGSPTEGAWHKILGYFQDSAPPAGQFMDEIDLLSL